MTLNEYKVLYGAKEDSAPGWDAIDGALKRLYSDQVPRHWATTIPYVLGGPDPLDGISAYETDLGGLHHLHFMSYGYSSLYYDEESVGRDYSQFGFEMTFRLACPNPTPPDREFAWVCNFFENLARYVFDTKKSFAAGHWIPANGPIRTESETQIVGLVFTEDPLLAPIATPHGRVDFVQGFGVTQEQINALKSKATTVDAIIELHRRTNPLLVTDLRRTDAEQIGPANPAPRGG